MSEKPSRRFTVRDVVSYLLVAAVIVGVIFFLNRLDSQGGYSYGEVRRLFVQEQVRYFSIDNKTLKVYLKEANHEGKTELSVAIPSLDFFYSDLGDRVQDQLDRGIIQDCSITAAYQPPWWVELLPSVIFFTAVMVMVGVMVAKQTQTGENLDDRAGKFGRARARTMKEEDKKTTFADVAGAEEEKAELQELVDFLKDPDRFSRLGARIPKGVLLVGPPGTGKTLLAKAVAGEAGVSFLSISGSDFVELYVGIGASRVRDLFRQAKEEAPAIVFIDEIDAVGRQRGAGLGGGHDEREQTLNQLLVEMDGFEQNAGVIVMAATNRRDILDPALLRPGRFDRQVYVGYPDIKGREEILKVHARNKPLGEDVSFRDVARATAGFTGADLENLLNEAALLAARAKRPFLNREDLHQAMLKVIAGPEKKSKVVSEGAKRLTAYHEAGHAVVIHELPTADPVHQITIIPRGGTGGMTISLPTEDRAYQSKRELTEEIATCLGGRVAEELALGDISTGASNDLERATAIARAMVTKYGMSSELGAVVLDNGQNEVFLGRSMAQTKPYSEEVAGQIDREVRALVDEAQQTCEKILTAHRDVLDAVAAYLLEHETMDAETFETFFTPAEDVGS